MVEGEPAVLLDAKSVYSAADQKKDYEERKLHIESASNFGERRNGAVIGMLRRLVNGKT